MIIPSACRRGAVSAFDLKTMKEKLLKKIGLAELNENYLAQQALIRQKPLSNSPRVGGASGGEQGGARSGRSRFGRIGGMS